MLGEKARACSFKGRYVSSGVNVSTEIVVMTKCSNIFKPCSLLFVIYSIDIISKCPKVFSLKMIS